MEIKKISQMNSGMLADGDIVLVEDTTGTPKKVEYAKKSIALTDNAGTSSDGLFSMFGNPYMMAYLMLSSGKVLMSQSVEKTDTEVAISFGDYEATVTASTITVTGGNASSIMIAGFMMDDDIVVPEPEPEPEPETPTCATPIITQEDDRNVYITCSTSGATIHYKTSLTDDYDSATLQPIHLTINSTITVYAYASKDGYNDSPVASKLCVNNLPQLPDFTVTYNAVQESDSVTCTVAFSSEPPTGFDLQGVATLDGGGMAIMNDFEESGSENTYTLSSTVGNVESRTITALYVIATCSGYNSKDVVGTPI